MIVFFGPAGAGKSVQGQILAARHGWRWLSSGQLLRDSHDSKLLKQMSTGKLADTEIVNSVIAEALSRSKDIDHVILDGYPRKLSQAQWLVSSQPKHERSIELIVVLEVPRAELFRRLKVRGRQDDTVESIEERLKIYRQEMYPVLSYFNDQGVRVSHIQGIGSVGMVHDRIEEEIIACKIV